MEINGSEGKVPFGNRTQLNKEGTKEPKINKVDSTKFDELFYDNNEKKVEKEKIDSECIGMEQILQSTGNKIIENWSASQLQNTSTVEPFISGDDYYRNYPWNLNLEKDTFEDIEKLSNVEDESIPDIPEPDIDNPIEESTYPFLILTAIKKILEKFSKKLADLIMKMAKQKLDEENIKDEANILDLLKDALEKEDLNQEEKKLIEDLIWVISKQEPLNQLEIKFLKDVIKSENDEK